MVNIFLKRTGKRNLSVVPMQADISLLTVLIKETGHGGGVAIYLRLGSVRTV